MHKLINKQTGEFHLCEKIEIDGFDYYVGDEIQLGANNVWVATKSRVFKFEINMAVVKSNMPRIVIATNNPNIDCPKVVDEVEIKRDSILESDEGLYSMIDNLSFKVGFNKSQETHPNSDEDMKSFLKFSIEYRRYNDLEGLSKTSDELLQLWKEQKTKTVYYE